MALCIHLHKHDINELHIVCNTKRDNCVMSKRDNCVMSKRDNCVMSKCDNCVMSKRDNCVMSKLCNQCFVILVYITYLP